VKGGSPELFATTSIPVLETLATNKQLTMRAALPSANQWLRRSPERGCAENTQFSIVTPVLVEALMLHEIPAPHGLAYLSTTSTF
jgi:hypothetical protein